MEDMRAPDDDDDDLSVGGVIFRCNSCKVSVLLVTLDAVYNDIDDDEKS